MKAPGELLASGRDADIFEFGPGQVLRRSRNGRSMLAEAQTMEFVRSHGYPAPEIFEVSEDGCDLVMERIEGPTMVDAGAARPWNLPRFGRQLAELHVTPSPSRSGMGSGRTVRERGSAAPHGPPSVECPRGPPRAHGHRLDQRGPRRSSDRCGRHLGTDRIGRDPGGPSEGRLLRVGRKLLLDGFLKPFTDDALDENLAAVVDWKCTDSNMSSKEIERMRSMVTRAID